jgi:hypothetical protein
VVHEERLAQLEGRVGEHSQMFIDFRVTLRQFEQRVDTRFTAVDARFAAIDARFDSLERRFDALGGKVEAGFDGLRREMTGQFRWTVGVLVTGLVAVVAAVIAQ